MLRFADRADAGRRLAARLAHLRDANPAIFALPRGGVPVAAEIAASLKAPLDLVLVRKIGAPQQPELAIGAIVDGGDPVVIENKEIIEDLHIPRKRFAALRDAELVEIERRRDLYLKGRPRIDPAGRTAIIVDDGLATGATARAALAALKRKEAKRTVLAVPVAPTDTLSSIKAEADEIVCIEASEYFPGVGGFYRDFRQLEDADVIAILDRLMPRAG